MKASFCEIAATLLAGVFGNDVANAFMTFDTGYFEAMGINTACVILLWIPMIWTAGVIDYLLEQWRKNNGLV